MMKRKEISQESFRGMMKLAVGAAMFAAMAFTSKVDAQQIQVNPTGKGTPKYVFLFIGDGMSYPQIQSSAYYLGKDAAGSFGLAATAPFTAFLAGMILAKNSKKRVD